jgi:hypothetical protein
VASKATKISSSSCKKSLSHDVIKCLKKIESIKLLFLTIDYNKDKWSYELTPKSLGKHNKRSVWEASIKLTDIHVPSLQVEVEVPAAAAHNDVNDNNIHDFTCIVSGEKSNVNMEDTTQLNKPVDEE